MSRLTTLYDKIWDAHLVDEREDGTCLLYIDRHLIHEVTSPQAFEGLRNAGRKVRRPDLTLAVADHNVPTSDRSKGIDDDESRIQIETLDKNCADFGVELYGMDDIRQDAVRTHHTRGSLITAGLNPQDNHAAFSPNTARLAMFNEVPEVDTWRDRTDPHP